MKRKIAIVSLFALMLASCGSKSIPTYTITIKETLHFTPSKTTFTFKENDFTPITFTYTTDQYFNLTSIESDNDECECSFKGNEQTITITPKANTNIEITPTLHRLEGTIGIRIDGDSNFTPSVPEIIVLEDDFEEKFVKYTISNNYHVSSISVEPSGAAECYADEAAKELRITLKENKDCVVSINSDRISKEITFDAGAGTLVEGAETTIEMYYGTKWSDCFDSDKQVATYQSYDFLGWSTADGGHGEVIDPNYVIAGETPSTVYASYAHHINMTSASLEVSSINYDSNPRLMLNLKDSKYEFPLDENAFTITNSEGDSVGFTYGGNSDEKNITINDPEQVKDGIINIVVTDYQPEYNITYDFEEGSYLEFESSEILKPKKGEDFTFRIKAVNSENATVHYVPKSLSILIGTSTEPLSSRGYSIIADDDTRLAASVIIYADYIYGDIKVTGKASDIEVYYYEFKGKGINIQEAASDYIDHSNDLVLNFIGDWSSVDEENIAVKFDNATWYTINELPGTSYDGAITYNLGKITIHKDHNNFDSLAIYAVSQNWDLFEESSWEEIEELAYSGYVERLFDIGQEKHDIVVDGQKYTARIIDFNHNEIFNKKNGQKAPITFEFEELITKSDGSVYKGRFGDYGSPYSVSNYCEYLENTFRKKLPDNMLATLKDIEPECCDGETYGKVFALSGPEIGRSSADDEGFVYKYYENKDVDLKRYTCADTQHAEPHSYWTRTRKYTSEALAGYVNTSGSYHSDGNVGTERGYIAAFCI